MLGWLKKHFIPGAHNEHRPHLLRLPAIRSLIAAVIVIEALFLVGTFVVLPNSAYFGAVIASVMTVDTNKDRAANQISSLTVNPFLEEAARRKAADMVAKGYFAHIAPDGTVPWKWLKDVGYYYLSAGENLAINFTDSKDVTDAWMNSPAHRANILNEKFTEIGIGTAEGKFQGKQTTFVVQYFGKPYDRALVDTLKISTSVPRLATTSTSTFQVAASSSTAPGRSATVTSVVATSAPLSLLLKEPETDLLTYASNAPLESETLVLGTETAVGTGELKNEQGSAWLSLFTNPRRATAASLLMIAGAILIALMLAMFIRIRVQHFDLISNGLLAIAVILFVLLVNDTLSYKDLAIF